VQLSERYARYREALRDEPLPCAAVDLDALERNVDTVVARLGESKKTLRIASKSVRSVDLLRRIAARGGAAVRGIMAYTPAEACFLFEQGLDDLLVAYPTAQRRDAELVAEAITRGAAISLAADDPAHLAVASAAGARAGVRVPIVVDVDVSYRPLGDRVHIGVRRSPLREPGEVAAFVERVLGDPHLAFAGLLAYEAHIAGVPDHNLIAPALDALKRAMKRLAQGPAREQRAAIVAELARRGIAVPLFNGGGTGSVAWSSADPALTEVAAGSGFLDSHLFDGFEGLPLSPAAFFGLQITRRPAPGFVTCQGGGLIASGAAGPDRSPIPYLPEGLSLTGLEGAGEVQTPLAIPAGLSLAIGDPVFFRHAKAGELAEHFASYALVRGDRVEGRAITYRGAGKAFG
jgi:D-serine deaminase-like pyridoxal phosphate-dependent protein